MRVLSFEPPKVQQVGGLEAAIRGLTEFLRSSPDIELLINPDPSELLRRPNEGVIAHFHGLWQFRHLRFSAACRRAAVPYVVSPHGMLEPWAFRHKYWKKRVWFELLGRRHLAGAGRILSTSELEAANIRKLLAGARTSVLPLGLTSEVGPGYEKARNQLEWLPEEQVILFLSRLHIKKGLHLLLKALRMVPKPLLANSRLVVVGGGEEHFVKSQQEFAVRNSACLPRIDWIGEVWNDRKWLFFQAADLFCLPSLSENFGLAVLEALQVGTPVLTTSATPWPDLCSQLPDSNSCFSVEPTVEDIARGLGEFLASQRWNIEERTSLANEIQRRFSWGKVGPLYRDFYHRAAEAR